MLTTTAAGRVFDHSYCIGMYGMSGLGFWDPVDFALGANGVLYVINRGGEELGQRISKCTTDHQFLGQFGGFGPGDGQFIWPTSIDLDRDENLYVADEYLQRISIFDKDGKFGAKRAVVRANCAVHRAWPSTARITSTLWTVSTAASRSSPKTDSF
jgi:hypothetical protein